MRVDVFLLADAATVADGKLYVHGGGITRINTHVLPLLVPTTLTVRFAMEARELEEAHRFSWVVRNPDGSLLMPEAVLDSSPGEKAELIEGEEGYLQLTIQMPLMVQHAGVHRVTFSVDGEIVRDMTVPVVLLESSPTPALPPAPNRAERRRQHRAK
jgi:hypothetical protein